jgi:hypothetical protein
MNTFDEKRIDQIGQNGNDGLHYSLDDYDYINRGHSYTWKHKTKIAWIVFYDKPIAPFYEAFTVKAYVKNKQNVTPWALDNERLSNGDGYKTLDEAMQAVENLA